VGLFPAAHRTLVPVSTPITPGSRLHDRFVLIEQIGAGGMSQVWRATDEVLGRPVAVKMVTAAVATIPALRDATWREARAAGQLTHPHVTRVYDYGQAPLPDGTQVPYLVMEFVAGQSLAARLSDGAMPWPEAARCGAQVAAALAAAHRLGVVHHDIKPGNVMLTADGAKVLDFGIAALVGATDDDLLVGTPSYAAPERLRREPARPANDVYSLGVLLHECVTGHPPARLPGWPEAFAAHQNGPPPPTLAGHRLPPDLVTLITSCLTPDPDHRPEAHATASRLAALAGIPDPNPALPAEEPTVATPLRYAVGHAAPSVADPVTAVGGPPTAAYTRVDHGPPATGSGPGRRSWPTGTAPAVPLAVVVAVVVVVAALALVLAGFPRSADDPSAGADGPAPTALGQSPVQAPSLPPLASLPSAPDPLAGADQIVARLERLILDAFHAGRIDADAVDDLWDELAELRDELAKDYAPGERREKVRAAAEDLREEIDDLLDDRDIPPDLARQLRDLLRPLLTGDDG
jgi:eukaryotic-like serine/threonine-protein kinase